MVQSKRMSFLAMIPVLTETSIPRFCIAPTFVKISLVKFVPAGTGTVAKRSLVSFW